MIDEPTLVRDEIDERILAATEALIGERGYTRVRFIDVADSVGVSIGSLQHRFRTREGLLWASVVRADKDTRREVLRAVQDVNDPWDRLSRLLDHILSPEKFEKDTDYWLQLVAAAPNEADLLDMLRSRQNFFLENLRESIFAGIESGRMVSELSPEDLAVAILAFFDGLFSARSLGDQYGDAEWTRNLVYRVLEVLVQPVG
jgi:AcrR family transcriptional regulator